MANYIRKDGATIQMMAMGVDVVILFPAAEQRAIAIPTTAIPLISGTQFTARWALGDQLYAESIEFDDWAATKAFGLAFVRERAVAVRAQDPASGAIP